MAVSPSTSELPAADLPPCHVAVVFATGWEATAFERRLAGAITVKGRDFAVRQGGMQGRGVVVVRSGAGRKAAERATELLITGHRPRWILSAGLAGGLQDEVKRGDIVMPNLLLGEEGQRLAVDFQMPADELAANPQVHVGSLVTVDRVVARAVEKRELGARHSALAVDMETLAVAEVCRRQKQRFLAVRVISDPVDEELPVEVERLVMKKTLARQIGATAGTIFRRPSIVKDLWRFRETAMTCSERLAKFLEGIVKQL